MEVRRAGRDEWLDCADIYVRSARAAFTWADPRDFRASDLIAWAEGGEELYLAFDQGRPIAMMSFWRPDNFIHNLFVDPDAQGRGAGTALLRFACGLTGGPVSLKCDPRNERALGFYRARGLVEVERGAGLDGAPFVRLRRP